MLQWITQFKAKENNKIVGWPGGPVRHPPKNDQKSVLTHTSSHMKNICPIYPSRIASRKGGILYRLGANLPVLLAV